MGSIAKKHLPASLVCEAIAKAAHVITNCRPFGAADDSNVLDGQDGEEEILVCPVVPVFVHPSRWYMDGIYI